MEIIINRKSIQPIYEQVVEQIKEQVSSGEMTPGDRISSVRALAKELKIGALTVQKAYDILQREGIIESVVGKGTIISQNGVPKSEAKKEGPPKRTLPWIESLGAFALTPALPWSAAPSGSCRRSS